jgi:hypothetical protein
MLPGVFFLLGQNGLHHISGLGDVGEIDLGHYPLRRARSCRAAATGPGAAGKVLANLLGLKCFQGAGVRLTAIQAEFHQYLKNSLALDFHLSREIVDPNLTHPPLFKWCYPMPVSCS